MLRASLKIAFGSLLASRSRTILTTIGITIGVASILLVFAAGEGARTSASANVAGIPASTALLAGGGSVSTGSSPFDPLAMRDSDAFTDADLASLTGTHHAAAPITELPGNVSVGGKANPAAFIAGTSSNLFGLLNLTYSDGSDFGDGSQNSAVIGNNLAYALFGTELASGKTFSLHGDTYSVAGVLSQTELPLSITGVPVNTTAFISLAAAQNYAHSGYSRVFATVPHSQYADVTTLLTNNHAGQTDFTISQPSVSRVSDSPLLNVLVNVTAVTAGLSLIIGGIGIMNIMLVNVSERTREIGIRKSIGASSGNVLAQFLIESVVMSLAGGILGTALGLAIAVVAGLFLPFGLLFTPRAIFGVLGVSLGIGILFGLFPAIRAARKDPIEAMRYYQ